jgi:hypothetical protein
MLSKDIKANLKRFYAYVRSKTKVKDSVGPLLDADGKLVSEVKKCVMYLIIIIGSVFTEEKNFEQLLEIKDRFIENSDHMLQSVNTTREIVNNELKKNKKELQVLTRLDHDC